MKWRFKQKELRLRISPPDKEDLLQKGQIKAEMGPLNFLLTLSDDVSQAEISLKGNQLTCSLPLRETAEWLEADEMACSYGMDNYTLLVEKDLSCSHSAAPLDSTKHFGHKFE